MGNKIDSSLCKLKLTGLEKVDVVGTNYSIIKPKESNRFLIEIISLNNSKVSKLYPFDSFSNLYKSFSDLDTSKDGAFFADKFDYFVKDKEIIWIFYNPEVNKCYYDDNFVYFIRWNKILVFSKYNKMVYEEFDKNCGIIRCKYVGNKIVIDEEAGGNITWITHP